MSSEKREMQLHKDQPTWTAALPLPQLPLPPGLRLQLLLARLQVVSGIVGGGGLGVRRRGAQLPLPLLLGSPPRWQRQQQWQRQRLQLCSAATETPRPCCWQQRGAPAACCQRIIMHHWPGVHAYVLLLLVVLQLLLAWHACCSLGERRWCRGAGSGDEVVRSRVLAAGSWLGWQRTVLLLPEALLLLLLKLMRCICRLDPIGYYCCIWEAAVQGSSSGHSRREVGPAGIKGAAQATAAAAAAGPIWRCRLVSAVVAAQEAQGGGAVWHTCCRLLLRRLRRLPLIARPCGGCFNARRCKALREEPGRSFLQSSIVASPLSRAQRSLPAPL